MKSCLTFQHCADVVTAIGTKWFAGKVMTNLKYWNKTLTQYFHLMCDIRRHEAVLHSPYQAASWVRPYKLHTTHSGAVRTLRDRLGQQFTQVEYIRVQ